MFAPEDFFINDGSWNSFELKIVCEKFTDSGSEDDSLWLTKKEQLKLARWNNYLKIKKYCEFYENLYTRNTST